MKEWQEKLDGFLAFNDRAVLPGADTRSREEADVHAERQYQLFEARRREALENAGEAEAMRQLEETARKLPRPEKQDPLCRGAG